MRSHLEYSNLEMDSRMAVTRGWGAEGNREFLFKGYRVSVLQDGVLEMDHVMVAQQRECT